MPNVSWKLWELNALLCFSPPNFSLSVAEEAQSGSTDSVAAEKSLFPQVFKARAAFPVFLPVCFYRITKKLGSGGTFKGHFPSSGLRVQRCCVRSRSLKLPVAFQPGDGVDIQIPPGFPKLGWRGGCDSTGALISTQGARDSSLLLT